MSLISGEEMTDIQATKQPIPRQLFKRYSNSRHCHTKLSGRRKKAESRSFAGEGTLGGAGSRPLLVHFPLTKKHSWISVHFFTKVDDSSTKKRTFEVLSSPTSWIQIESAILKFYPDFLVPLRLRYVIAASALFAFHSPASYCISPPLPWIPR